MEIVLVAFVWMCMGVFIGTCLRERISVTQLRREIGHLQRLNLELKEKLVDRERAEDQAEQIARIPEDRQIEILENIWARKAA